jgi:hypothetical protein
MEKPLLTRIFRPAPYLTAIMSNQFDFCIPTRGTKVPHTPDWIHEIKYDGYRLRVERNGDRVRLFTRNGYDWTKRCPWIAESRSMLLHVRRWLNQKRLCLDLVHEDDWKSMRCFAFYGTGNPCTPVSPSALLRSVFTRTY